MAKEKKKSSGTAIWVLLLVLIVIVVALVIYRFVNNNGNNTTNTNSSSTSTTREVIDSGDYNARLQDVQKQIDDQEEKINKINQEISTSMEERTQLEQQLIDLSGQTNE